MQMILAFAVIGIPIAISQFPPHMDLEKVGEAIFDNEQYNVLKPTIHVMKDHFQEYILGKDRKMNKNGKIYLDNDGFRHIWYGRKAANTKSLRKADITDQNIELNINDQNDTKPDFDNNNESTTSTTPRIKHTDKSNRAKLRIVHAGIHKRNKNTLSTPEPVEVNDKYPLRNNTKGQTLVKATFYCPFIGLIKMATVI